MKSTLKDGVMYNTWARIQTPNAYVYHDTYYLLLVIFSRGGHTPYVS